LNSATGRIVENRYGWTIKSYEGTQAITLTQTVDH